MGNTQIKQRHDMTNANNTMIFKCLLVCTCFIYSSTPGAVERSVALQITKAGGCGQHLKDVNETVMAKAKSSVYPGDRNALFVANATNALLRDGIGLNFLSFFITNKNSSKYPCVIGWFDTEDYSSKSDAAAKLHKGLDEAIKKGLSSLSLKYTLEPTNTKFKYPTKKYTVDMGETNFIIGSYIEKITIDKSPAILGREKSYELSSGKARIQIVSEQGESSLNTPIIYDAISHHLPDGIYLYTPAIPNLRPYPVVYHKGQKLYFVKP